MAGRTTWINDSCPCRIILNNNQGTMEFDNWIQKCFIHKDEPDGTLLSTVLTHNHQYDGKPEVDKQALRSVEFIRIRNLGDLVKNTSTT